MSDYSINNIKLNDVESINTAQTSQTEEVNSPQQSQKTNYTAKVSLETKPDTVEISGKKKEKSLFAKIAIGAGTLITVLVGSMYAISKHQTYKLNKLYKEKLIPKIFDKELKFTEAKTIDEALKYAREVLGVEKFNENITLDALNYVNRGITDVVNKNIGQEVFIPKSYLYDELENGFAHVVGTIRDKRFGELAINKKYFDNEFLTKKLDEQFHLRDFARDAKEIEAKSAKKSGNGLHPYFVSENELVDLLRRYKADANNLSIAEKRTLLYSLGERAHKNAIYKFDFIEFVEKNKDKIKLDIEELKKLPRGKQGDAIDKYLKENNMSLIYELYLTPDDGISTIYHEMGHLQDFAKNLKEIDLKFWKLPSWKDASAKVKAKREGKPVDDRIGVEEFENRWGGTTYAGFLELLKNKPEKFKKLYPDLYKHLKDEDTKKTAMKVSVYATTSIGEFVADVYKKMISGEKIPEDVLKLYKKYNGPLPNAYK